MGLNVKKLDKVGEEFSFNYGRQDRNQTNCGGWITIAALIVVLAAQYTFIKKLVDKREVNVQTAITQSQTYPRMNLLDYQVYPIFLAKVEDVNGDPDYIEHVDIPEFINIEGIVESVSVTDYAGDDFGQADLALVDYVPCDEVNFKAKNIIYGDFTSIKELGENFGVCAEITDTNLYYISGNLINPPTITLQIIIQPCLGDALTCQAEGVFGQLETTMIFPEVQFDPTNFKNPLKIIPTLDQKVTVHPDIQIHNNYKFKTTEITDEPWDFVGDIKKAEFFDVDVITTSIKERTETDIFCAGDTDCSPLIVYDFVSGGKKVLIKRDYASVMGTFGELGGANEFLFLVAATAYLIYSCRKNDDALKKGMNKQPIDEIAKYQILDNSNGDNDEKLKRTEEAAEELLMQRQDGLELFRSMNNFSVIENAFFQGFHKVLIPIALINKNAKLLEEKNKSEKFKDNDDIHLHEMEEEMSPDEAIKKLRESEPNNEIEKAIKAFLLNNLPDENQMKAGTKFEPADNLEGGTGLKLENIEHKDQEMDFMLNSPANGSKRKISQMKKRPSKMRMKVKKKSSVMPKVKGQIIKKQSGDMIQQKYYQKNKSN